ncbi:MAG TPA: alpha/beta fold hydrolase [Candidatus Ruania gallistercoris]|uniref:Alpha/beta fold hydrolase n=1 Tax=Candidatus Ruania gallistercoris TaxID=2838746 RepID=A0A9D2EH48_9MICO|nr:alpha/beta fold hydrolase [Candidatus Ruania gallistercoris]
MTRRVTSADGTRIAYDRKGTGPAVILVGGTLDDGAENAPLARLLADHFTVYNYARRGRGASGNTPPYSLERELEDLDALIATAGGSAHVYGASSGGALVLEAAAAGSAIDKIATWDAPYAIGDDLRPRFTQYLADTRAAHERGRDEEMLELFVRLTGGPDVDIAAGKQHPFWAMSVALAHTLVKDAVVVNDYEIPTDRLARITQSVLVITEGPITEPQMAALPADFFDRAATAITAATPRTERATLDGQGHVVDPEVMARVLTTFFERPVD